MRYLRFFNRLIGCCEAINWLPCLPDLPPIDFFGGTVKNKVFACKPRTVEDMIQFILDACQEIDAEKDFCSRACMSVCS